MGQKHSANAKKQLQQHRISKPDSTEVLDFEYTDPEQVTNDEEKNAQSVPEYPQQLISVQKKLEELEFHIDTMTASQINLYFPTFKDELHNNWQKVYEIVAKADGVKEKKVDVIERIKSLLDKLNNRYFRKNRSEQSRVNSGKT